LRRNQIVDLGPTIEQAEVVDESMEDLVKTRHDIEIIDGLDEYPSYCDFDRKIHIDCTYNLQFSCMIDFIVVENMDAYRDEKMSDILMEDRFVEKLVSKQGGLME
nr:hypothetical protein [Tanacetum cinerariifolium]